MELTLRIEKFIHGGQALARTEDGKKVFVWGALPGELVEVRVYKKRRSYVEAITTRVIEPSDMRVPPQDMHYISTAPWQICNLAFENSIKAQLLQELFAHEQLELPEFSIQTDGVMQGYRNKMEYSFYGDDDGLHLALFVRGSHHKQITRGSTLAVPTINTAAQELCENIMKAGVRAGDLKSLIVRASQDGTVAASLFVKKESFAPLPLSGLNGLRIYYSTPKSPASVRTKLLHEIGTVELSDTLLQKKLHYDVDSFFQVNIPMYQQVLHEITRHVLPGSVLDLYSGVGSIGLTVTDSQELTLVELDEASVRMAQINARELSPNAKVVHASSEMVLETLIDKTTVILDPPRAGLHQKLSEALLEAEPQCIIYMSCNPVTQLRDVKILSQKYITTHFYGYNFFPGTQHIETLAVLQKK